MEPAPLHVNGHVITLQMLHHTPPWLTLSHTAAGLVSETEILKANLWMELAPLLTWPYLTPQLICKLC